MVKEALGLRNTLHYKEITHDTLNSQSLQLFQRIKMKFYDAFNLIVVYEAF